VVVVVAVSGLTAGNHVRSLIIRYSSTGIAIYFWECLDPRPSRLIVALPVYR
jgi:hypothetical protein